MAEWFHEARSRGMRLTALAAFTSLGAGCNVSQPDPSTIDEIEAFEQAGPIRPVVDREQIAPGVILTGPYRVVPGDRLDLVLPTVLVEGMGGILTPQGAYSVRVDSAGMVDLPQVGKVEVAGKTIVELENAVADAVHPKLLRVRPPVRAVVTEYYTHKVAVVGAVATPGIFALRSDQMSVFAALTAAGGIRGGIERGGALAGGGGARLIRVKRRGHGDEYLTLPIRGTNIPFGDARLVGGETIEVERFEPELLTVIGLVRSPGAFPYPSFATYTLMQAIGLAGGVDRNADPPYATVFRQDHEGKIVSATFALGDERAFRTKLRPGDVVSLQHTVGSWSRSFLSEVFRIQLGFVASQNIFNDN